MIAQFALRLLCGISLMWCLMPRKDVTSGFFRIQSLVALGLSILAALTVGPWGSATDPALAFLPVSPTVVCIACAVLAWLGSVFWRIEWRPYGTFVVFAIAVLSALSLLSIYGLRPASSRALRFASEFAAAGQLGSAVTAMLLGHWYLTAPTMSIAPLEKLNLMFGASAVLRLILSAAGFLFAGAMLQSQTHWVWLTLRWCAGIIAPLILCWMVVRILRYRNTQSATGVMFAAVILVFIGEMTAAMLDRELQATF